MCDFKADPTAGGDSSGSRQPPSNQALTEEQRAFASVIGQALAAKWQREHDASRASTNTSLKSPSQAAE